MNTSATHNLPLDIKTASSQHSKIKGGNGWKTQIFAARARSEQVGALGTAGKWPRRHNAACRDRDKTAVVGSHSFQRIVFLGSGRSHGSESLGDSLELRLVRRFRLLITACIGDCLATCEVCLLTVSGVD